MLYELKNTYNFPASLRAAESRVAIHFFHSIKNHFPQSLRAVEDGAAIHSLRLYHEAALFILDCFPPAARAVAMTL